MPGVGVFQGKEAGSMNTMVVKQWCVNKWGNRSAVWRRIGTSPDCSQCSSGGPWPVSSQKMDRRMDGREEREEREGKREEGRKES